MQFCCMFVIFLYFTCTCAKLYVDHDISSLRIHRSSDTENEELIKTFHAIKKIQFRRTKRNVNENVESSKERKEQKVKNDEVHQQDKENTKENPITKGQESRTSEDTDIEAREEDFIEAADFGIRAMNDLYLIKEPKLYSMGLFLRENDPARFVAAFNEQTQEAKHLAKFGYAALEAARKFRSKFPNLTRQASIPQNTRKTALRQQCPKKGIPQCPPASLRYRTSDGSCNNLNELWWGSAISAMQRFLPPVYEDGIQTIRRSVTGGLLPSARHISDYIHEDRDAPLTSVTHMLMQWGQFIDHDITATGQSRAFNGSVPQCCLNGNRGFQPPEFMHPECLPIVVHPQDSHLGRLNVRCLEFVRSGPAPKEDCEFGAREQLNQVTSFIDASTVYSSNARQSDSLRIFRNGLMQYGKLQSRRPVLPRDDSDLCIRGSLSTACFKAGDGRLSEQPALTSLHVVFLRLHNRLATRLAALNPHWTDEKIFQETRKIVGAVVQHITYREFLPIVLGHDVMKIFDIELVGTGYYKGYDKLVDPSIANAFATAAYRFGHSLVQHSFVRFNRDHQPLANNVTIHEEFSNPANLETAGSVDRILLGLVNQQAQRRDEFISVELTNHLFQNPAFPFGMDLASLNVQRGRDHGIPPFVDWRAPCSLSPIRSWNDLDRIMSPETAKKFRDVYSAVEDIDLFSAGLAEKPVVGGLVGPTFACIIGQQFRNLRKGDRFWYENPFVENRFSLQQLEQIKRITLAQILCSTMDNIDSIQPFVMLVADNRRNQRLSCSDPLLDPIDLDAWIERPLEFREDEVETDDDEDEDESRDAAESKSNDRFGNPVRRKPVATKINQQNRIIVKRPLGPHENLTISVHNNAVNSPVIIRDSIYGSNFEFHHFPHPGSTLHRPQSGYETTPNNYNKVPPHTSRPKPTPMSYGNSFQSTNPYYPHSYNDGSNPNPPNYGFNSKPSNNYYPSNEFFAYTTKAPRPQYRPTVKPPDAEYQQENSFIPKPEGSYNQASNRPSESIGSSQFTVENTYPNFEPNNSGYNQNNPNYHVGSTAETTNRYPNTPNRPLTSSKRPNYVLDEVTKPHTEQMNTWQNINPPQNEYILGGSSSYPSNRPLRKQNGSKDIRENSQNEEFSYENRPHYLHTHTTISNIEYVPAEKVQRYKLKVDLELPRPLKTVH